MAIVGTPNDRGTTLEVIGVDAPGGGNPSIFLDDVERFNEFTMWCAAGIFEVFASLDGVTFAQIALENKHSTTPGTRFVTASTGLIYYVFGNYRAMELRGVLGGPSGARLICGKIGR